MWIKSMRIAIISAYYQRSAIFMRGKAIGVYAIVVKLVIDTYNLLRFGKVIATVKIDRLISQAKLFVIKRYLFLIRLYISFFKIGLIVAGQVAKRFCFPAPGILF